MEYHQHINTFTGYVSYDVYEDGICLGRCSPQIAKLLQDLDLSGYISGQIKKEAVEQAKGYRDEVQQTS